MSTLPQNVFSVFVVQGWHKKNGHHQKLNNFQILFRLTQNFSYIRPSLCSRHLQSFKSVLQKLFVSLALKKCAPNELPGAAGTFGSGGQSSRSRMVQWCHVWRWQPRQCTSQSVMAFADSAQGCATPEDVVLRVHVTWQQKMCLVRKPDIVKKVWHSVNLVAKPLAHNHSLPHVVRYKLLFNLYPPWIHVEICDQNSPHGLPVDSKLLTSPTHTLLGAMDNSLWQQQCCVVSLMISVVQSVIVC